MNLLLILLSLIPTRAFAESTRYFFPSDTSSLVQTKPGKYLDLFTWYREDFKGWDYIPEYKTYSTNCSPQDFQSRILSSKLNGKKLAPLLSAEWTNCKQEFEQGLSNHDDSLTKLLGIRYDIHHHPLMHRIAFAFPDGTVLKGLMALKDRKIKRPLVIVRLGIFSNSEDFIAERALLMGLFEQGPFNVLILDSLSSAEYATRNPNLSIGAPIEALQNMQVAKLLQSDKSPFKPLIYSTHLIGVSLGGNGMLKTVLLNEFEFLKTQKKYFNGFMGLCPVVNLYPTLSQFTKPGFKNIAVDFIARFRMEGFNQKQNLGLFDILKSWIRLTPVTLTSALNQSEIDFPKHMPQAQEIQYPFEKTFQESAAFVSNLENIQTPVNIFYSHDDPYVSKVENSQFLQVLSEKQNNNFGFVGFQNGIHCTFQSSNDWNAITALINSTVLSQSEFRMKMNTLKSRLSEPPINPTKSFDLSGLPKTILVQAAGKQFEIPLKEIDVAIQKPNQISEMEKEMLLRWLDHNVGIRIEKNNEVLLVYPTIEPYLR